MPLKCELIAPSPVVFLDGTLVMGAGSLFGHVHAELRMRSMPEVLSSQWQETNFPWHPDLAALRIQGRCPFRKRR